MTNYKLDTDKQVFFYEQEFYVLSNFAAFNLNYGGMVFQTSEHAYHYLRFAGDSTTRILIRDRIRNAPSAHEAFRLAQEYKGWQIPEWNDVKVEVMLDIIRKKAKQHEYVRRKLLETGSREIIEDSWRDSFWGWGPNKDGQNMLGKLWMRVRADLIAERLAKETE